MLITYYRPPEAYPTLYDATTLDDLEVLRVSVHDADTLEQAEHDGVLCEFGFTRWTFRDAALSTLGLGAVRVRHFVRLDLQSDAWQALTLMPDFFTGLAGIDTTGEDASAVWTYMADVQALLHRLGAVDRTQRLLDRPAQVLTAMRTAITTESRDLEE